MTDVSEYDYQLPKELIAQQPVACRSDARLMVVDRGQNSIQHVHVRDLPDYLNADDALVLNDSKVIPARLVGRREKSGGRWHGLFLRHDNEGNWKLMCKTRGKLFAGERIIIEDRDARDSTHLRLLQKLEDGAWIVRPESDLSTWDLLDQIGRVPLPNYIRKGEMVDQDLQSYQTVYASERGSVAAPTAGLHFTNQLLGKIEKKGTAVVRVTLHVGAGTFQPIRVERLEEHQMHSEWGSIDRATSDRINGIRTCGGRLISVGTTAVRVLESCVKDGLLHPWSDETNLFISPPYNFQAVDCLMTNFHLPRSTLLVLVRTFGGSELIKRAYAEAVEEAYRFYSYGDAMLIL